MYSCIHVFIYRQYGSWIAPTCYVARSLGTHTTPLATLSIGLLVPENAGRAGRTVQSQEQAG